jgi:hypothetical protein
VDHFAEKDHNPKVRSYFDALVFLSTCMSVGYANVFARTPAGKAIASAVMTFGPAMSGAIFDAGGPETPSAPRDAGDNRRAAHDRRQARSHPDGAPRDPRRRHYQRTMTFGGVRCTSHWSIDS